MHLGLVNMQHQQLAVGNVVACGNVATCNTAHPTPFANLSAHSVASVEDVIATRAWALEECFFAALKNQKSCLAIKIFETLNESETERDGERMRKERKKPI